MLVCVRLLTVLLALSLLQTSARADEDLRKPPEEQPQRQPPPQVIVIQPPPPMPPQMPMNAPPSLRAPREGYKVGLGTGVFALSPTGMHTAYHGDPAAILQARRVSLFSDQVGFEFVQSLVMHDWAVMADIYRWYFRDTDEDPNQSDVGAKLLLLWPGMLVAPLVGSNFNSGVGLIAFVSELAPSLFIDAGGEFQFMLRPSDPDFRLDIGFGFYAGFGIEISPTMGVSLRTSYVPPLFHAASEEDRDLRAVTVAATLDFVRW